jgi:hypothetical protein
MLAHLVPPSAWITSQSIQIVRSPIADIFATDLIERPISLCISIVLPPSFPFDASR